MNFTIGAILRRIRRDVWDRKGFVTTIYFIVAMMFLGLGWILPRIYTSNSIILVDQANILSPLMQGTAVTNNVVVNHSKNASQVIFNRSSMAKLIEAGGWLDKDASPQEREKIAEDIQGRTQFENEGKNLFSINYRDNDPQRAFKIAQTMTDIFVNESLKVKQKESRDAYDFINNQVNVYHQKLLGADNKIKEFRSRHVDYATPGSKQVANERLLELKRQLEEIVLEISIEESKLISQQQQLTGQSTGVSAASLQRENELNERIVALEQQLDELRLNYLDTYPDIVKLKSQIKAIEAQVQEEIENRKNNRSRALVDGPLYQELRSEISKTQTNMSSLKTKHAQIQELYVNEQKKMERINSVDAEISELTRDYAVNKEMYQTLLRQRESAMISMNIDIANQGLTIKVQESAAVPTTPKGLRFAHVVVAGLFMSFAVSIGGAYVLSLLDGKVRDESVVVDKMMLPVLASVYSVSTPKEKTKTIVGVGIMMSVVLLTLGIYGYAIYLRLAG